MGLGKAIKEASPYLELYDSITQKQVHEIGIHGREPLNLPDDPWKAALAVKAAVAGELETARFPVTVGGEHSISLGAITAALDRYPKLTVLQLDAHADLRDEYQGSRFSHACVMKRVADTGAHFVQAGVRSMSYEERQWLDQNHKDVISSRRIISDNNAISTIVDQLNHDLYLTLDLDVLDPSEMPATGTPEPGGISYQHIIALVLAIKAANKNVVGFDVVELAPIPHLTHPQFLAASLIYTMIGAFNP